MPEAVMHRRGTVSQTLALLHNMVVLACREPCISASIQSLVEPERVPTLSNRPKGIGNCLENFAAA